MAWRNGRPVIIMNNDGLVYRCVCTSLCHDQLKLNNYGSAWIVKNIACATREDTQKQNKDTW